MYYFYTNCTLFSIDVENQTSTSTRQIIKETKDYADDIASCSKAIITSSKDLLTEIDRQLKELKPSSENAIYSQSDLKDKEICKC